MKVKFLKEHLEHKAGDEMEVDADRANYWKLTGVAEEVKDKKQLTAEELIEKINVVKSLSALEKLIPEKEERVTVLEAFEKKKIELKPKEKAEHKPKKEKKDKAGPNTKK